MRISKLHVNNFRSIKDSGEICFSDRLFVLAGQNESGKSSILNALHIFETGESDRENLNFELENQNEFLQKVRVTYTDLDSTFFDGIISDIHELIKKNLKLETLELDKVVDKERISSIREFSLTREFDFGKKIEDVGAFYMDTNTFDIIKNALKFLEEDETSDEGKITTTPKPYIDLDLQLNELTRILWRRSIPIVLFDDFQSLLPDKILLDDLQSKGVKGIDAVKNVESLLKVSFEKIALKLTPQKNSTTERESADISANFQKDWKQKIFGNNNVNIKFFIENNESGKKEISFFVETKNSEYLAPRRRSKGMIWFLSLWLELKSREDMCSVLLFDEPGLHLHVKANSDMLNVFHKLISKGHQVIYSTHSPSLIETNRLHNIGLVINSEKTGTTIESLTTSKINTENKRDALQPIAEAMGLEPVKDFSVLKRKNILLEGLSDFWYFKAMCQILRPEADFEFIPGIGIKDSKIKPLVSFCIGYGLEWLLIMDNGELPKKSYEELKAEIFFNNQNIENKIKMISEKEIENLFDIKDFQLIDESIKSNEQKEPIDVIGAKRKVIFAKKFIEAVMNGTIKKENLQASTIFNFEEIFKWIDLQFSKS